MPHSEFIDRLRKTAHVPLNVLCLRSQKSLALYVLCNCNLKAENEKILFSVRGNHFVQISKYLPGLKQKSKWRAICRMSE